MKSERKLILIQFIRALAALAVAFAHIPNIEILSPDYSVYGSVGVDLFFVVSGFIIVYSARDLFARPGGAWQFICHRIARIVPIYWLATFIVAIVYLNSDGAPQVTTMDIVSSLAFIPVVNDGVPITGVGWTLNFEMFFYACFSITIFFPRNLAICSICVFFAACAASGTAIALPLPFRFWFNPIIIEFIWGVLLGGAYLHGIRLSPSAAIGLVCAGLLLLFIAAIQRYVYAPLDNLTPPRYLAWGVPALLIVSGAALSRVSPSGRISSLLATVGDASYCIYLIHPLFLHFLSLWTSEPVGAAISWILTNFRGAAPDSPTVEYVTIWVQCVIFLAVLTAVSIAVHFSLERPLTSYLKKVLSPGNRQRAEPSPA